MATEAQTQANRAKARKSTSLCVRSDRVSGIGVRDGMPAPSGPVPWASAPNKPNFDDSKTKGKRFGRKDLWLIEHPIGLGKTKPIPATAHPYPRDDSCDIASMPRFRKQSQFGRVSGRDARTTKSRNARNRPNSQGASRNDEWGIRHPMPAAPLCFAEVSVLRPGRAWAIIRPREARARPPGSLGRMASPEPEETAWERIYDTSLVQA